MYPYNSQDKSSTLKPSAHGPSKWVCIFREPNDTRKKLLRHHSMDGLTNSFLDTSVHANYKVKIHALQDDPRSLCMWIIRWCMSIAHSKCCAIALTRKQRNLSLYLTVPFITTSYIVKWAIYCWCRTVI